MTTSAPPRRDPALGLLDRLVSDALDPGYRRAAERRRALETTTPAATGDAGPWWQRHWLAVLGLAVAAALISLAAAQHLASAPQAAERKQELAAAIDRASGSVDSLEQQVRTVTAEVGALQGRALGSGAEGRDLKERLDRLGPAVGVDEVSGPGLVVTLDDAPSDSDVDPDLGRVLDRDLQHVVNGLWQAGAEAIDINGQRLTSLSAIRAAGDALLVNYRPLVRPYVVTAIGSPETLGQEFASGPAAAELETLHQAYGIRYDVKTRDQVTVPGETVTQLREAKEIVR